MLLEVSQHSLALHMHQLPAVQPPLGPPSLVRLSYYLLATLCCILTPMETCTRLSLTHFYNQTIEQLYKESEKIAMNLIYKLMKTRKNITKNE